MKTVAQYGLVLLTLGSAGTVLSPMAVGMSGGPSAAMHGSQGGYLGIDLRDIGEEQVAPLRLKDNHGAEIVLVDHDAPAGKAGLREHDVVLRINGQAVANQDQARKILRDCPPTSSVILSISREGQMMSVTARMSTRDEVERRAWQQHMTVPEPQDAGPVTEAGNSFAAPTASAPQPTVKAGNSFIGSLLMNSTYTGAMLEQLNKQLAQFFGVTSGTGLLVRSVVDNSPAAMAGMHVGDVVIRANDRSVASTGDWSKAIKSSHGRPLSVVVLRDKKEQTLTLTPDAKHRSSLEELFHPQELVVLAHLNFMHFERQ